jgi:hypothetical protein
MHARHLLSGVDDTFREKQFQIPQHLHEWKRKINWQVSDDGHCMTSDWFKIEHETPTYIALYLIQARARSSPVTQDIWNK